MGVVEMRRRNDRTNERRLLLLLLGRFGGVVRVLFAEKGNAWSLPAGLASSASSPSPFFVLARSVYNFSKRGCWILELDGGRTYWNFVRVVQMERKDPIRRIRVGGR